jgi:hypothetical protein
VFFLCGPLCHLRAAVLKEIRKKKEKFMAAPKTAPTNASVEDYLNGVPNEAKRQDSFALLELMKEVTGENAMMWGPNIVGFGSYHYTYASGREGDWMVTGFAPRKQALTVYIMSGFDRYDDLMANLGKHNTGKSCLYIKRLSDVDTDVLRELVAESVAHMNSREE